jgi:hypothetical protein
MNILAVRAQLLHADDWVGHDVPNSCFPQVGRSPKKGTLTHFDNILLMKILNNL